MNIKILYLMLYFYCMKIISSHHIKTESNNSTRSIINNNENIDPLSSKQSINNNTSIIKDQFNNLLKKCFTLFKIVTLTDVKKKFKDNLNHVLALTALTLSLYGLYKGYKLIDNYFNPVYDKEEQPVLYYLNKYIKNLQNDKNPLKTISYMNMQNIVLYKGTLKQFATFQKQCDQILMTLINKDNICPKIFWNIFNDYFLNHHNDFKDIIKSLNTQSEKTLIINLSDTIKELKDKIIETVDNQIKPTIQNINNITELVQSILLIEPIKRIEIYKQSQKSLNSIITKNKELMAEYELILNIISSPGKLNQSAIKSNINNNDLKRKFEEYLQETINNRTEENTLIIQKYNNITEKINAYEILYSINQPINIPLNNAGVYNININQPPIVNNNNLIQNNNHPINPENKKIIEEIIAEYDHYPLSNIIKKLENTIDNANNMIDTITYKTNRASLNLGIIMKAEKINGRAYLHIIYSDILNNKLKLLETITNQINAKKNQEQNIDANKINAYNKILAIINKIQTNTEELIKQSNPDKKENNQQQKKQINNQQQAKKQEQPLSNIQQNNNQNRTIDFNIEDLNDMQNNIDYLSQQGNNCNIF